MKTPTELTQLFRDRGLRVTAQRQSIFRVLHGNGSHPTAHAVFESVHEEMPTISLRTVYQTLNDLVALGEIQQFDVGTGAARFDPATSAHDHVVCNRCGAMRDVQGSVAGLRLRTRPLYGFSIAGADVIFRGLCPQCLRVTNRDKEAPRG